MKIVIIGSAKAAHTHRTAFLIEGYEVMTGRRYVSITLTVKSVITAMPLDSKS